MDTRDWIVAVIACVTDFVLAAGGAFSAVVVATDSTQMLSPNALATIAVTGLIASARRLQAMVSLPPMSSSDLAAIHNMRATNAAKEQPLAIKRIEVDPA